MVTRGFPPPPDGCMTLGRTVMVFWSAAIVLARVFSAAGGLGPSLCHLALFEPLCQRRLVAGVLPLSGISVRLLLPDLLAVQVRVTLVSFRIRCTECM